MEWKASYELGHAPMDDTHREFVDLVARLARADGAAVLSVFDALVAHTVEHFEQENRWMKACAFPPIHCHTGEHDRVLQSLKDMRPTIEADPAVAKILVKELEPWFAQHASTMDDALAFFMRQVNYTPTAGGAAP